MLKEEVAVLDIGSSKITVLIGGRGVNRTFNIGAISEYEYDGYQDGSFFDVNTLKSAVSSAVSSVRGNTRNKVKKVFVGVPGEFLKITNKKQQISFRRAKKITDKDVEYLYNSCFGNEADKDYSVINVSAVYFVTDGNRRVSDARGVKTEKLGGLFTGFYCSNYFIGTVKDILNGLGVTEIEFVAIPLAEALYLFTEDERASCKILLDIGYMSSAFSLVVGDGILYQRAYSIGGGFVSAYLMDKLNLPTIKEAEKIKRKLNLALSDCNYEIVTNNEVLSFKSNQIHPTVTEVLNVIAEWVCSCLEDCERLLPESYNIGLTGGGISFIRGARDLLISRTEVGVEVVVPNVPYMNKPNEASKFSLLDFSLKKDKNFKNIFR